MALRLTFGPGLNGAGQVDYRDLRVLKDDQRIEAWCLRQERFLRDQVDPLAELLEPAKPKLWAPFPLAVMTCIGVEMLGAYKYGDSGKNTADRHFQLVIRDIDPVLESEQKVPSLEDSTSKRYGKARPLSDFLYEGFRNALAHGYYGKWVFITHDPSEVRSWEFESSLHILLLNVYWFYQRYREVFADYANDLRGGDPALVQKWKEMFERHYKPWL